MLRLKSRPLVIHANGGKPRSLGAPCDPCGEQFPEYAAWSPDGSQIAFIDFTEDSPLYGHHAYGLSFVNPDGTDLREEVVHLPGGAGVSSGRPTARSSLSGWS